MPTYGGTWTFKVFPTAPPAQWAMQNEQMRKDAHKDGSPERIYSGTISNPGTGVSYRVDGGIIVKFPAVAIPGQTYEGMIDFEEITSLVDGGTFNPPRCGTRWWRAAAPMVMSYSRWLALRPVTVPSR